MGLDTRHAVLRLANMDVVSLDLSFLTWTQRPIADPNIKVQTGLDPDPAEWTYCSYEWERSKLPKHGTLEIKV
jgi:hypothetical protein